MRVPCAVARLRTLVVTTFALLALAIPGCSPSSGSAVTQPPQPAPPAVLAGPPPTAAPELPPSPAKARAELPRGGRTLFPGHRLVGFCGTPGAPALGELQGNLSKKTKALLGYAEKYSGPDRKVLPVFELIAVIVQSGAGPDGKYRRRVDDKTIDTYLQLARESKGIFLLNIQPGQADFLSEVKQFEKYLREPDIGIALDPEWAMKAGQRPGKIFGQTTGALVNEIAEYLSKLVADNDLPEKALVFHQVNRHVLKDESTLKTYPGVAVIKSVDGLGPKHSKIETYLNLMQLMTSGVHPGFKLFFDEDHRNGAQLMTPKEVMALRPIPEYVMYE